jgi:hypothetical protein
MTTNQDAQPNLEIEIKELREENDLLLHQLYQVQEELESGYLRNKELGKVPATGLHGGVTRGKGWVDEELTNALAESRRLQALVDAQRDVHRLEMQNGLNVKLGDILVKSVDSLTALVSVPTKVGKIWFESRRRLPPKSIGGENFDKVVAAYCDGGFASVEKLIAEVAVSPAMWASAYTVLARQLMNRDRAAAAQAAHRAYVLDPKPYRLKWFAFRLHEAGRFIEAEALLDIVSPNTQFSESEARQAGQLRREAKHFRQNEAKQKAGLSERRAEIEKQFSTLKHAKESLEQERTRLLSSREEVTALAEERGRVVERLRLAKESLEQEKVMLLGSREQVTALAEGRGREVELLRQAKESLEQEKARLLTSREELTALAERRGREVELLMQAKESLEQEKARLLTSREELTALAAGRGREVEILSQAKESLEQENARLVVGREQLTALAEGRTREVEILRQTNESLEQKLEVQVQFASRTEHIESSLKRIEQVQKQGLSNAVQQVESLIRLQNYLGADVLLPEVHHWAISPDFGVLLIHLLEQNRYDAVVEFGSGTSTLVIAKSLERVAQHSGQPVAPLLSFDHLEQFQRQSQKYLERAGLTGSSRVVWAPLQAWRSGETPYYTCEEALWQLRAELHQDAPRVLVVVDGPPGRTGPLARHPALPKVLQGLGDTCCFHFLMDDYDRQDERDIVSSWERGLSQIGRTFKRTEFRQLEKQACLLEVSPLEVTGSSKDTLE